MDMQANSYKALQQTLLWSLVLVVGYQN